MKGFLCVQTYTYLNLYTYYKFHEKNLKKKKTSQLAQKTSICELFRNPPIEFLVTIGSKLQAVLLIKKANNRWAGTFDL